MTGSLVLALALQVSGAVLPGDPRLHAGQLRERVDTVFLVRVRDTARTVLATVVRTRRRERESGRDVWHYAQEYRRAAGVTTDTSVVDGHTLAPLRYRARLAAERHVVTFAAESIVARIAPDTGAAREVVARPHAPVFNAVANDLVLEALRLNHGARYAYYLYNPPRGVALASAHVAGMDTVRLAGGDITAWVVEFSGGGAPTTIWIATTTGEVIGKRSRLPDGSEFWQAGSRWPGMSEGEAPPGPP